MLSDTEKRYGFNLDRHQLGAVQTAGDRSLVVGAAGTGKTQTLLGRAIELMERGEKAEHICLITCNWRNAILCQRKMVSYSARNPAAKRVRIVPLSRLVRDFLRSYGARLLGMDPYFSLWSRRESLGAMETAFGGKKGRRFGKQDLVGALEASYLRRSGWSLADQMALTDNLYRDIERAYAGLKSDCNALDEADVIQQSIRALETASEAERDELEWARHILIDDFHMFNRASFRLVQLWLPEDGTLMVASNPDQCIGRASASWHQIQEYFKLSYAAHDLYPLYNNYCTKEILAEFSESCNEALAAGRDHPRPRAMRPPGFLPVVHQVEGDLVDLDRMVLRDINDLLGGGTRPGDIAVLYFSPGRVSRFRTHLAHQGMSYAVLDEEPWDTPDDARWLLNILKLLVNPRDLAAFRIAAAPTHVNKNRVLAPAAILAIADLARKHRLTLVDAAARYVRTMDPDRPEAVGLAFITTLLPLLSRHLESGERSVYDIAETACQELGQFKAAVVKNPGIQRLATLTNFLKYNLSPRKDRRGELAERLDLFAADQAGPMYPDLRAHRFSGQPADALTFSTIRGAMGLTWPVVLLLDVSDENIPGKAPRDTAGWHEQRRLFYTAVTRGTDELHLYTLANSGRGTDWRPTSFLDPVSDLVEYQVESPLWLEDVN